MPYFHDYLKGEYKNHSANDPWVVCKNDLMMSINTTMEIDITGPCCSETLGHQQLSGTGGQAEMAEGAQMSTGGKSFICLHSTANIKKPVTGEREKVSKILPVIQKGSIVTLPRANVDYVVTEFGVADLRGTSIKERVKALVNIAHPDFRKDLLKQAKQFQYI